MQEQIDRLSNEITSVSKKVDTLVVIQPLNHAQNRKDIHELRNGQQNMRDALYNGFEKVANSLESNLRPIREDVKELQLWKSKTTGYVLGISAASAAVFALVEKLVSAGLK